MQNNNYNNINNGYIQPVNVPIARFYAYKTSRYGLPWVCIVGPDGRYYFDYKVGEYTAEKGREGDLIVYNPQWGYLYAFGQKDYQGIDTVHAFAWWDGAKFVECNKNGELCEPHKKNENEKDESHKAKPLPLTPMRIALNNERFSEQPYPLYPYPVNAKLYAHQIKAANMAMMILHLIQPEFAEQCKNALSQGIPVKEYLKNYMAIKTRGYGMALFMEMGLGKTITEIAIAGAAYQMGRVSKLLIVAPTSVCNVWPSELEKFAAFPFKCALMTGTKKQRLKKLAELAADSGSALQVVVINYESVWRTEILKELMEWKPDMVAADESHRIKNPTSNQAKALHKLGEVAAYKLILSGTPIQNNVLDLFSQYLFLDGGRTYGDNYWAFRNHYAVMGGYKDKQVVGYKYLDELTQKEHDIALRVTKKEALDLPEQVFMKVKIPMTGKARDMYDELVENSYLELEGLGSVTADNALTKIIRLQQFTGGFFKSDDKDELINVYDGKQAALEDILDDYVISSGKKLVIFCRFIAEINLIEQMLAGKKINYACIQGGVPVNKRDDMVDAFQNNPAVSVCLCQIDTAGTGLTLTAADTCVYWSMNYKYAVYAQSLARIHRIGQRNTCTYIFLIAEDTVDEQVMDALERKEDMAKSVVDDWRKYFKMRPKKKKASKLS